MYHCNIGFPVVDEEGEYLFASEEVIPATELAAAEVGQWDRFSAPNAAQEELVYYHRLRGQADGTTYVAFINRAFNDGEGIGAYVRFHLTQLPWLCQWRMPGAQAYVTGIEPATGQGAGRPSERASGRMVTIAPAGERRYNLEMGVLVGEGEIGEMEAVIRGL